MGEGKSHFRNQKVTAPLKPMPTAAFACSSTTYFRNQKVTAPLKLPDEPACRGEYRRHNFRNQKVTAPLKLPYDIDGIVRDEAFP